MIGSFRRNGIARLGTVIPSLILFFLILLFISSQAMSIPSRSPDSEYNIRDLFPEKFFLNIDNGLITLITMDNPLGPILEEISSRIGIKIKFSPSIRSKKITVRWKAVPLEYGIKNFADDSGLFFGKDEEGNLYLSEVQAAPETEEHSFKSQEKVTFQDSSKNTSQAEKTGAGEPGSDSSEALLFRDNEVENHNVLNEMVIRFKQDIPEQEINKLLSDANIKVKKYIAALKYHILTLPEGMTCFEAMVLLENKKMIYQKDQNYLFPVK